MDNIDFITALYEDFQCLDDDVLKMKNVAKILSDVVHSDKNIMRAEDKRKMHMFLLLNTNLQIKSELEEDDNYGHIVGCTPVISKDLYLELVSSFALQKYFCEAIVYTPFSLGAELLQYALLSIGNLEFNEKLVKANEYGTAVYHKFRLLDSKSSGNKYDSAKLRLYKHFKKVLEIFHQPNTEELTCNSINELYNMAGLVMENLLELFNNCLKLYVNSANVKLDHQDIYSLKLSESLEESNEETNTTSETFIVELLNICNSNFQAITVDMFLYWADSFADTQARESLQQRICETMYYCAQNLIAAQKMGMHSNVAEQITSALLSMGKKPRDEDDEIREADLSLIIKNVSDKTKTQNKWFKALVQHSTKLSNRVYFKALEQHLSFADSEDMKTVIEKTMTELNLPDAAKNNEELRSFALIGVKGLHADEQLDILDWFFLKYGINTVLRKADFKMEMVYTFNKSVHLSKEKTELVSEFIYLCLQSSYEVIARMVCEGLSGTEQAALTVAILKSLNPIRNIYVMNDGEVEYSKTERNGTSIISHNVQNVTKENLNDKEKQCFVPLVALLAKNCLIDGPKFIVETLLPHIHDAHKGNQENLLVYVETLNALMEVELICNVKQLSPLLVFLGSLLERWNIYTFSMKSVQMTQKIQILLKRTFQIFLDNKCKEDKEIIWLQHKLQGLTPLNKCYFKEAWSKFGKSWVTNPNSTEMVLLELMLKDPDNISNINESLGDKNNDCIAFYLAKILPLCTPMEWKSIARHLGKLHSNLSDTDIGYLKVAMIFTDSLVILIQFINWQNAHNCLDYCVRNIGKIIKEEILPKLDGSQSESLIIIFQKVCYGLGLLPADMREECSIVMANSLVDVVQKIADSATQNVLVKLEELTTTLGFLHSGKALQVLANKLMELKRT